MSKLIWQTELQQFKKIIQQCYSIADVLRYYGLCYCTYNKLSVQKRIQKENIDISHFKLVNNIKQKTPNKLIFVKNSTMSRNSIKKRIIQENIIPYKCDV